MPTKAKKNTKPKKRTKPKMLDMPAHLGPQIVAVDGGNGKNAAFRVNEKGALQSVVVPHGRAQVRGVNVKVNVDNGYDAYYMDWVSATGEDSRYTFGDDLAMVTTPIETQRNDAGRYGDDMHVFTVMRDLALLGVSDKEPVHLVVGVPPGYTTDDYNVVERLQSEFMTGQSGEGDGVWHIKPKDRKTWLNYIVGSVTVIPEGYSAMAAYAFGLDGLPVKEGYMYEQRGERSIYKLAGLVSVQDAGYGTHDQFLVRSGQLLTDTIENSSDPNGGIQERLVQACLPHIREIYGSDWVREVHVDMWLRAWAEGGFKEEAADVTIGGGGYNLHKLFDRQADRYSQYLLDEKILPAMRSGADRIALVGGGWTFAYKYVQEKRPDLPLLHPTDFPHLKSVPIFAMNGYGSLVAYAQKQEKARRKKES